MEKDHGLAYGKGRVEDKFVGISAMLSGKGVAKLACVGN